MPATLQAFLILFIVGAALRLSGLLGKVHAERLGAVVVVFVPQLHRASTPDVPLRLP